LYGERNNTRHNFRSKKKKKTKDMVGRQHWKVKEIYYCNQLKTEQAGVRSSSIKEPTLRLRMAGDKTILLQFSSVLS